MQSQNFPLSIIIPVCNEVTNVLAFYQELTELLSSLECPYEVIFVDDGSDDGTRPCLKQLASQYTEVKVIMHLLPALFKRAGYRVINIPVNHRSRRSGVSKYGVRNRLWVGIIDLIGVCWLTHRPCNPEIDDDAY